MSNVAESSSVSVFGLILIALILFVGLIVLQVFLSRTKSKIPGLIIPIISFTISLLAVAIIVLRMVVAQDSISIVGTILPILGGFIPANIPTAIHLLIYFIIRKKLNADNNQEMKKMTIQDLE